jgi:hypothetical protein
MCNTNIPTSAGMSIGKTQSPAPRLYKRLSRNRRFPEIAVTAVLGPHQIDPHAVATKLPVAIMVPRLAASRFNLGKPRLATLHLDEVVAAEAGLVTRRTQRSLIAARAVYRTDPNFKCALDQADVLRRLE